MAVRAVILNRMDYAHKTVVPFVERLLSLDGGVAMDEEELAQTEIKDHVNDLVLELFDIDESLLAVLLPRMTAKSPTGRNSTTR